MPPNYAQMSVVTDWEILLTKLLQSQDPQQPFQEILYVLYCTMLQRQTTETRNCIAWFCRDYVSEEKRLAVAETDREIERALQLEVININRNSRKQIFFWNNTKIFGCHCLDHYKNKETSGNQNFCWLDGDNLRTIGNSYQTTSRATDSGSCHCKHSAQRER